jgi:hypothetical protein
VWRPEPIFFQPETASGGGHIPAFGQVGSAYLQGMLRQYILHNVKKPLNYFEFL